MTKEQYIERLNMKSHPEGGYFIEFYKSNDIIKKTDLPDRYSGDRSVATCIYFLITSSSPSKLHKLNSDEIWTFVDGDLAIMHVFSEGSYANFVLGRDHVVEAQPSVVVPANTNFGVEVKGDYALFTCTVAPGFEFDDFDFSNSNELLKEFPSKKDIILRLS